MPIRLLIVAIAMLFAVPAASAASFDCAKASSRFEKAICADPELSATDEVLSVAYKTATGGLTEAANATMLQGQRDWLAFLDKTCADDMLPGQEAVEVERAACLSSQYLTRIRTLEGSRMLGGLRFYQADTYWAAPDPEGDHYYRIGTATTSSALIDGKAKEAKAFNAMIEQELAGAQKSFAEGESRNPSSDTDFSLKVTNVNPARIDVEVSSYWYGHGAAHGNYAITYLHFLRDEGRNLKAEDLFAGEEWVDRLAEMTLNRLKQDRGELLWDIEDAWLKEVVADPGRWDFTDSGLVIQFQPYEVASYAEGAVRAELPWVQLQDYLSQTGSSLAYR